MASIEITTPETESQAMPVDPASVKPDPGTSNGKRGRRGDGDEARHASQRAAFREVLVREDQSLKEAIEVFGPDGSYKIAIKRVEPETVMVNGQRITIAGHIDTLTNKAIDEDYLRDHYGGGKYELKFMAPNQHSGKFTYVGNKTVPIAGKPNLAAHGISEEPQHAPGPANEAPGLVNKAMDVLTENNRTLQDRLDRERDRPAPMALPSGPDPATTAALAMLERQNSALTTELSEMRRELVAARTAKPAGDEYKDKFLDKLIDGDSARINAVRSQLESEIRQAREFGVENERRLRDEMARRESELNARHEREIANLRASHELAMMTMRQSHELTVATMKQSHDLALAAARGSFETQAKLVEGENRRLERDLSDLKVEHKELRGKKDKSLIETLKEVETVKKALELDGDAEPKGALATLAEAAANPEVWGMVGQVFGKKEEAPPAAPPPQRREQVFRDADGQYVKVVDGQLVPVKKVKKKKPKRPAAAPPAEAAEGAEATEVPAAEQTEPEIEEEDEFPELPEDRVRLMVSVLEASVGKQAPEIVAQSMRTQIPPEALDWLANKTTEIGVPKTVQMFFTHIKLSGGPLATQDGRNWSRAFVRALVGAD